MNASTNRIMKQPNTENQELSCVLIPVGNSELLLPNVSIAEILPWRRVKPIENADHWCLGVLGWRGEKIPVVRFEVLNGGGEVERRVGRCLVVMNRARSAKGRPFWALVADGLPRILQLDDDDVTNQLDTTPGPAVSALVEVGTEPAVVPNLEYIEKALAQLKSLD